MIISRTPFRISFFGGGTDYPAWYRHHGGAVLASAIDKYCYITCRYLPPFFQHRFRVVWSKIENCQSIEEITHPVVREALRLLAIDHGLEIHHDGDLPARGGIGSSSSFTVGLLNALHALVGRMLSKPELVRQSLLLEQDIIGETVGSQDQVSAAYGGFNRIEFSRTGDITVDPMTLPTARFEELNSHLMLFYTGLARTASEVAKSYVADIEVRATQLTRFRAMVDEATLLLNNRHDINEFGELLHEAWLLKKSLSTAVSNRDLDDIYGAARAAGAVGGKISGAGGGGFMLLFVPPARHEQVRQRLSGLLNVPFRFESAGTQVVFYDPGQDYSEAAAMRSAQELRPFRELVQGE